MGKITEVTRCDRLTRVHNGRNPITAQLYLRNKSADLPNEFSLEGTKCDDFAFELFTRLSKISLGRLSWVWVEQSKFTSTKISTSKPLLIVRFFLRIKKPKRN